MRIRVVAAVILSLLLSVSVGLAGEASDAAYSMVKTLGLGNNLAPMALRVATSTQTYRMIDQKLGNEKAKALVKEELEHTIPKYQEPWNKNLALSYAEYFEPTELRSIANEKQASKYYGKFSAKQGEVGKSMQAKSTGLLNDFVTEAMTKAFTRATK
jgi:hypothetical protein